MKKCTKCNINKELSEFHKMKDSYRSQCKECRKILTSEYRNKNKSVLIKKQINYYNENKEKVDTYTKKWRKINKEKVKKYSQKNNIKLREYKNKYNKEYRIKNIDKIKLREKNYRLKNPELYAWRRLLSSTLICLNQKKENKTKELLGYSSSDLKTYITSKFTDGMSWNNYGEWHIDHIKPLSKFDKLTPPNIVNSLSNLQPLWATTREINGITYIGNLNKWAN